MNWQRFVGCVASCSVALALAGCGPAEPGFDLVIRNGMVVDGSGAPGFMSDLGVRGDRIVAIEQIGGDGAGAGEFAGIREIDAAGLVVAPGFIDSHSHSDYTLLVDGTAQSKIRQGVTTEINGEQRSAGPLKGKVRLDLSRYGIEADWSTLGEYFTRLEEQGISVNAGTYVGATLIRSCVLGDEATREPTREELGEMEALVGEAMRDGALGLSSALTVPPNTYVSTGQLVAMARVAAKYGGIYATHTRSGGGVIVGLSEAIEIGERAGVAVEFVHLNNVDRRMWGKVSLIRKTIEDGQARGVRVTSTRYPYIAGQNNIRALLPPWSLVGTNEQVLARLRDPAARKRIERDIRSGIDGWFNHYLLMGTWENVRVAVVQTEGNKQYEGKSIAEIAETTKRSPVDTICDLLLDEGGSIPAVYFMMSEDDVRETLKLPWVSIGSDGSAVRPDGVLGRGKPHPRWYGAFPRVLGKYVREEKVLTLPEAIRKMTSMNAEKVGITDRGLLKEGWKADITIFDPRTVRDEATFENPHQYATGIEYVIVNGRVVLDEGEHTGAKPGRVIRGPGAGSLVDDALDGSGDEEERGHR